MKKILFLICLSFLLTGCTINYNLEISDNIFKEKIEGNVLNTELKTGDDTDFNIYHHLLNTEQPVFKNIDSIYYNKKTTNKNEGIDYEYTYDFNENNFINSKILNECFDNFTFENKNDNYHINLSGDFKCAYTNKININIKTDYQVITNNAQKKSKNTYIWTIEKDNIEDLDFNIVINTNEKNNSNILSWSTFKTIGLFILLILSGIAIFIGNKYLKD